MSDEYRIEHRHGCHVRHDENGAHARRHRCADEEERPITLARAQAEIEALVMRVTALEKRQAREQQELMRQVRERVYAEIDRSGKIEPFSFSFNNMLPTELVFACLAELAEQGFVVANN